MNLLQRTAVEPRIQSFWAKVVRIENGCWNWIGSFGGSRYGVFRVGKTLMKAHRFSWLIAHGTLHEAMRVLHKCDNPRCVNPDHLFIGTQRDNVLDMESKGRARHPHGEAHGLSKLSQSDAAFIRGNSASLAQLAMRFGVSKQTISRVKRGITWRTAHEPNAAN